MISTPPNETLEVSETALYNAIEQIQIANGDPARTQESKTILVAVERTLHWIKGGAKGELIDLSASCCQDLIVEVTQVRANAA